MFVVPSNTLFWFWWVVADWWSLHLLNSPVRWIHYNLTKLASPVTLSQKYKNWSIIVCALFVLRFFSSFLNWNLHANKQLVWKQMTWRSYVELPHLTLSKWCSGVFSPHIKDDRCIANTKQNVQPQVRHRCQAWPLHKRFRVMSCWMCIAHIHIEKTIDKCHCRFEDHLPVAKKLTNQ